MELSSSAVGSGKFIAAHLHIAFSPLRDNRRRAGRTFPQTGRMAMSANRNVFAGGSSGKHRGDRHSRRFEFSGDDLHRSVWWRLGNHLMFNIRCLLSAMAV